MSPAGGGLSAVTPHRAQPRRWEVGEEVWDGVKAAGSGLSEWSGSRRVDKVLNAKQGCSSGADDLEPDLLWGPM